MNISLELIKARDILRAVVAKCDAEYTDASLEQRMNLGQCLSDDQIDLFDEIHDTLERLFKHLPEYEQDEKEINKMTKITSDDLRKLTVAQLKLVMTTLTQLHDMRKPDDDFYLSDSVLDDLTGAFDCASMMLGLYQDDDVDTLQRLIDAPEPDYTSDYCTGCVRLPDSIDEYVCVASDFDAFKSQAN